MIDSTEINTCVRELLSSAKRRDTTQGVIVYEKVLELLQACEGEDAVKETLSKLNRALAGMEAHGDFTDAEYVLVKKLRALEAG